MIARLHGILLERELQGLVVDCQGVGYAVACSLTTLAALPAVGAAVTLHVYTHVAEDALRLYGFAAAPERRSFVALLGATGVGPKLALAILSTLAPAELQHVVESRDKTALTRIPGVGGKKAERLLVELQGKLVFEPTAPARGAVAATGSAGGKLAEVRSALVNLGFAREVAEQAAKDALQGAGAGADLAALVRSALRSTTRR